MTQSYAAFSQHFMEYRCKRQGVAGEALMGMGLYEDGTGRRSPDDSGEAPLEPIGER